MFELHKMSGVITRYNGNVRNIFNDSGGNGIDSPVGAGAGDILIYDGTTWQPSGTTGLGHIGTLQVTNVNNNAGGELNVGTTDAQDVNFFRDSVLQFLLSTLGAQFGVPIVNTAGTDLTTGTIDNQDVDIIRNNITQLLFTATGIELGVPLSNNPGTPMTIGTNDNQPITITQNGTTAMFVDSTGLNVSTNLTLAIGGFHNLYTVRLGVFMYDSATGPVTTFADSNWDPVPWDDSGTLNNIYLGFPFETNYDIEVRVTVDGLVPAFDLLIRSLLAGTEYSRTVAAVITPEAEQTFIARFVFTVPILTNINVVIQVWQNSGAALNLVASSIRSSGLY